MQKYSIPSETRIGHTHLKVSSLETGLKFYRDILGFSVRQRYGDSAIFLAAGDYHHHIGMNTWESLGAGAPEKFRTGLYHHAILYPTRKDLAEILKRLIDLEYPLIGAADHGVSEALYLEDYDGNGVELYWDKDPSEWPRDTEGNIDMYTKGLDLDDLLAELAEL